MKRILITLGLLLALSGIVEAQQEVLRSDGRRTQVDTYLRALKTLHLPYGPSPTFDGGLEKEGSIFFSTSDNSLYVWDGDAWVQVAPDTDLSKYYTKTQTDSILTYYATVQELNNGLALKVDKTTTINGHALSGDITLTASDVGALTKALADTYYKDINWVPAWQDITNKPSVFPPGPHTHPISQVTDLQDALDAKQGIITGAATTIASADLTPNRALISSGLGKVAVSPVTATELGYMAGVTSGVQGQIDGKVDKSTTVTNTGGIDIGGSLSSGSLSLGINEVYLNNRYIRKDKNDGNGPYTLSIGNLVGDTVNAGRLVLPSLSTTSEEEYLVVDAFGLVSKRMIDPMSFEIANSSGSSQFHIGNQDQLRVQGTGDTQISFNAATKTIVINSTPGQGGGGVVTSVFGRDGGVVAEAGDYNTDLVTEAGNLYFTEGRVRSTGLAGLTMSTSPITATDNVLQAFGKAQGQINNRALSSRELEVSGTAGRIIVSGGAQDLTQNREWIVDLVASGVVGGTYPKVTVDAYGRVTAGGSLVASDIPNLDADKITTGTFNLARLATGTASAGYYIDGGTGAWTPLPSADLSNYYTKSESDAFLANKFDVPTGTSGQYVRGDGTIAAFPAIPQGTVTSVGMSVPSALLSVTGSPITSSGSFSVVLPNRGANLVFAGPSSGADASPSFRSLVQADIPSLAISKVTGLQSALDGKEGSFSKGSLVAGDGVILSGTLTNRLVGSGDITITADVAEANLIAGDGISITGVYPDKTITNTAPNATHTGDVTGATALTITDGVVSNAKLANVPTATLKGRVSAGSGPPEDLTPSQVRTLINVANGATANQTDAYLLNRANHTGEQPITTITGLATELGGKESLSNKATNFTTLNNTLYPTVQAVANYVSSQIPELQTLTTPSLGQIGISGGNVVDVNALRRRSAGWNAINWADQVGFFNSATAGGPISSATHGIVIPHTSNLYGTSLSFRNNRGFFQSLENGVLQPWLEIATLDKTVNLTGNQTVAGNKTWSGIQTLSNLSGTGDGLVGVTATGTLTRKAESDLGFVPYTGANKAVDLNNQLLKHNNRRHYFKNNTTIIENVDTYSVSASSVPGSIRIDIPNIYAQMIDLTLEIFEYSGDNRSGVYVFNISGYSYQPISVGNNIWVQTRVSQSAFGSNNNAFINGVRFGYDEIRDVKVIFVDFNNLHSYPMVSIPKVRIRSGADIWENFNFNLTITEDDSTYTNVTTISKDQFGRDGYYLDYNNLVNKPDIQNFYKSGDVNIPALGGDYRVFPYGGASEAFDWNEVNGYGFYKNTFNGGAPSTYNSPKGNFFGYLENIRHGNTGNLTQYAHPYRVMDGKWMRNRYNNVWTEWVEFYHSGNLRSDSQNDGRYLQLTGGTVTGQIKRSTDAVASDDVPRLGQVQAMIDSSTPTINLGSGLRYDSDGKIALGYDIDTGEGKITDEYFTLLKGDLQEGGYFSTIQLLSFEDRIYQAAIVVADQLSGGDSNGLIVSSDQILATSRIQYQGNYRSNFNSNSLVDKGYVDDLLAGTLKSGDNISELVNDVNYISAGANITLLNNNAGFVSSGTGADQVRTNADLDSRYIQSESDPTIASHIKAIAASDISNWNSKISSVIAGSGIAVDATDPYNPVISATGTAFTFTGDVTGSGTGTIELTLSDDSVKTQHLADSSVTSFKIATNAVTNSKIANNAVDSAKIAANAVHTTHIADGAVTFDKMQKVQKGRIVGTTGSVVNPWTVYPGQSDVYDWGSGITYSNVGFLVRYEGAIYRNILASGNTGRVPPSSPTYWQYMGTYEGYYSEANFDRNKVFPAQSYITYASPSLLALYYSLTPIQGVAPGEEIPSEPEDLRPLIVGDGLEIVSLGGSDEIRVSSTSNSISGLIQAGTNVNISGAGTSVSPYVISATGSTGGASFLSQLSDVSVPSPVNNQILTYSGGLWRSMSLPAATSSTLGGVKQGSGVSIAPDGTISATGVTPGVFTRNADGLVPAPGGSGTSRFLREDGTWGVPPGGGGSSFRLRSGSNAYLSDDVTLIAGTNVTLNQSGQNITINASGGGSEGITALTGDVLASGTGSVAATIANAAVTNTKLANMEANTIKGRISTAGSPQNLNSYQVRTIINGVNNVSGTSTINLALGTKFYANIGAHRTFSFENFTAGLDCQLEVTNTSSSIIAITFSGASLATGQDGSVNPGQTVVFSFAKFQNMIRATKVEY